MKLLENNFLCFYPMKLIFILLFVLGIKFNECVPARSSRAYRLPREATSEGAINAAVLQGNNATGTGDLVTHVDENDNAVLEANAGVATKSNRTSEIVNVAAGKIVDKYQDKYELQAGTSVLSEANEISEVLSNTSVSHNSQGVQSGHVSSEGIAQGLEQSNVYQRFLSKMTKNGNGIKSLVTTSGTARGQLSLSTGSGKIDTDGIKMDTQAESSASALDRIETEVASEVNLDGNINDLNAGGYVMSNQGGVVDENSVSAGDSQSALVSSDTLGVIGAHGEAYGSIQNLNGNDATMVNEANAGVNDNEASVSLYGASLGSSNDGNAMIESTSNITALENDLSADSQLSGSLEGSTQNLSLISALDAKNNDLPTVLIGSVDTAVSGSEKTKLKSYVNSYYDNGIGGILDVGTNATAKDNTGTGTDLKISMTGAMEKGPNDLKSVKSSALGNATGDSSIIIGDSYTRINDKGVEVAGIGAEANSTGFNGSSTATEVRLKINEEEEIVAGGNISIKGTASETWSVSRLERIGDKLNRLNHHSARIIDATKPFTMKFGSTTDGAEPNIIFGRRRRKRSGILEMPLVKYCVTPDRCYWLRQSTDPETGSASYRLLSFLDLIRPLTIPNSIAEDPTINPDPSPALESEITSSSSSKEMSQLALKVSNPSISLSQSVTSSVASKSDNGEEEAEIIEENNDKGDTINRTVTYTKQTKGGGRITSVVSQVVTNNGGRVSASSYSRATSGRNR